MASVRAGRHTPEGIAGQAEPLKLAEKRPTRCSVVLAVHIRSDALQLQAVQLREAAQGGSLAGTASPALPFSSSVSSRKPPARLRWWHRRGIAIGWRNLFRLLFFDFTQILLVHKHAYTI